MVGAVVPEDDSFLADWMQHANPVIGDQTILDMSLPGAETKT